MKNLSKKSNTFRYVTIFTLLSFFFLSVIPSQALAQGVLGLPQPGSMVLLSPSFHPALLRGIQIQPNDPLRFDFIIDTGETGLEGKAFEVEATKLIKYFLASLTIPEEQFWVNLSPYEKERIIADSLGETEMGRDLLAQDYILKQLTATLVDPNSDLGKKFWDRVYKKAYEMYGTTQIPANTFNKIWIIPDEAVVYEEGNIAFVGERHLKVMLEEDYLSLQSNAKREDLGVSKIQDEEMKKLAAVSSGVVRDVLVPEIEKEVNGGKLFANLRQIFDALILATWYKKTLKDSLLGQVYVDKNKTKGVDVDDKTIKEQIYQQYLESFKKGVIDLVKVEKDAVSEKNIPRKYFSGGITTGSSVLSIKKLVLKKIGSLGLRAESFFSSFYKDGEMRKVVAGVGDVDWTKQREEGDFSDRWLAGAQQLSTDLERQVLLNQGPIDSGDRKQRKESAQFADRMAFLFNSKLNRFEVKGYVEEFNGRQFFVIQSNDLNARILAYQAQDKVYVKEQRIENINKSDYLEQENLEKATTLLEAQKDNAQDEAILEIFRDFLGKASQARNINAANATKDLRVMDGPGESGEKDDEGPGQAGSAILNTSVPLIIPLDGVDYLATHWISYGTENTLKLASNEEVWNVGDFGVYENVEEAIKVADEAFKIIPNLSIVDIFFNGSSYEMKKEGDSKIPFSEEKIAAIKEIEERNQQRHPERVQSWEYTYKRLTDLITQVIEKASLDSDAIKIYQGKGREIKEFTFDQFNKELRGDSKVKNTRIEIDLLVGAGTIIIGVTGERKNPFEVNFITDFGTSEKQKEKVIKSFNQVKDIFDVTRPALMSYSSQITAKQLKQRINRFLDSSGKQIVFEESFVLLKNGTRVTFDDLKKEKGEVFLDVIKVFVKKTEDSFSPFDVIEWFDLPPISAEDFVEQLDHYAGIVQKGNIALRQSEAKFNEMKHKWRKIKEGKELRGESWSREEIYEYEGAIGSFVSKQSTYSNPSDAKVAKVWNKRFGNSGNWQRQVRSFFELTYSPDFPLVSFLNEIYVYAERARSFVPDYVEVGGNLSEEINPDIVFVGELMRKIRERQNKGIFWKEEEIRSAVDKLSAILRETNKEWKHEEKKILVEEVNRFLKEELEPGLKEIFAPVEEDLGIFADEADQGADVGITAGSAIVDKQKISKLAEMLVQESEALVARSYGTNVGQALTEYYQDSPGQGNIEALLVELLGYDKEEALEKSDKLQSSFDYFLKTNFGIQLESHNFPTQKVLEPMLLKKAEELAGTAGSAISIEEAREMVMDAAQRFFGSDTFGYGSAEQDAPRAGLGGKVEDKAFIAFNSEDHIFPDKINGQTVFDIDDQGFAKPISGVFFGGNSRVNLVDMAVDLLMEIQDLKDSQDSLIQGTSVKASEIIKNQDGEFDLKLFREILGSRATAQVNGVDPVGGIDLGAASSVLQIKRDGTGMPLPLNQQPMEFQNIQGFTPFIINVTTFNPAALLSQIESEGSEVASLDT